MPRKAKPPRTKSSALMAPPAPVVPSAELTERERLYVQARAQGMRHHVSLRAAGFSLKSYPAAHLLEDKPHIAAALAAERRAYAAASQISRKDVIDGISEAVAQARIQADPMAQIAGWREIAKICGHYAPEVRRLELSDDARRVMQKFEAMSDEDLLQMTQGEVIDYEMVEPAETADED